MLFMKKKIRNYSSILKEKYHESYECVLKIKELIEHEYNYDLSLEEQLYLMIHIERIRTKATI